MHLKELTINGFKSFAKKGELEFSTPITAIVGPNGSGKSNVAEAFRFVLGEQSTSKMRGKKGEDLIFNGSDTTSRANRASVAILLDNTERNGKKVFPVDFDEITIERVVNRDGTNEYTINGSRARLKDVQELLAAANIGSTGHHIISQGEADRILSSNPKERREMIEDALGLKVFQYKKNESEKKLKKTLENITHVELLRREVMPHLKFLERQVKKIEKSVALQEELKTFYAEYLRREDSYIAYHHDRLTVEKQEPEKKLEGLTVALAHANKKLEAEEKDEKRDALMSLEKQISSVRTERQDVVRESGSIEGQISFLNRRIEEHTQKASETEHALIPYTDVERVTSAIEQKIQQVKEENNNESLRGLLQGVLSSLRELLGSAVQKPDIGTVKEERELEELIHEKKNLDTKLAEIGKKENEVEQEYQELKQSIEAENSASREAEREVFRIMNEQRELEQKLSGIRSELQSLERDRDEFKRELQEAVSLLGSGATKYFEYQIIVEGVPIDRDAVVNEDRRAQMDRRRELERMKIRLEELGAGATSEVLKEYRDVKERDEFLAHEIEDLHLSVSKLEELIADLTSQLNEQFIVGIDKISIEFNRFFILMFGGGEAKLTRVNPKARKKKDKDLEDGEGLPSSVSEDDVEEIEEGIDVDVKLPNKRVRGLEMLSGGERALTSIALIFAMSQVNPPLFVILDETDAALDEANSRRYGDMIESLAKRSQLILITHNRETMGRAGVLYGITMAGDGVSKLLSVKFDEALAVAK